RGDRGLDARARARLRADARQHGFARHHRHALVGPHVGSRSPGDVCKGDRDPAGATRGQARGRRAGDPVADDKSVRHRIGAASRRRLAATVAITSISKCFHQLEDRMSVASVEQRMPETSAQPDLLSPIRIRGVALRSRIAVSPMCQYSSFEGLANDWHLVHLGARAVGGAALVFAEATAVAREGRITPGDLGLWDDAHMEPLARIVRFIELHRAVPGIQLAHAGRKAAKHAPWRGSLPLTAGEGAWPVVSPSPLPFDDKAQTPLQLTHAAIDGVVEAFAAAAQRAVDVGFKVIEVHSAHGYLLHQFLS